MRFKGEELLDADDRDLRRVRGNDITMVFQEPMTSLNPLHTVERQIGEILELHQNLKGEAARSRIVDLVAKVGIRDPETRLLDYPHQLSGGQRQRVMIAMALANNPDLLIADEPTTALDVTVQAQIIDLLRELQQARHMAMIFISHDLHLVRDVADRVAVMYASQVVEEGPVDAVLGRPAHPYTQALLSCIPRRGELRGRAQRMQPIPGSMPSAISAPAGCRFHPRCAHARPVCLAAMPALQTVAPDWSTRCVRWQELTQ